MADLAPGVVTLFGGSGFIGSQAVRALARRGWRIRVAVRNPVLAIEIQPLGDPGQIQFMRCDITNPADVAQAVRGTQVLLEIASTDEISLEVSCRVLEIFAGEGELPEEELEGDTEDEMAEVSAEAAAEAAAEELGLDGWTHPSRASAPAPV